MVFRLSSNIAFSTMYPLFRRSDQEQYWLLFIAFAWAITLGMLVATRGTLGREVGAAKAE